MRTPLSAISISLFDQLIDKMSDAITSQESQTIRMDDGLDDLFGEAPPLQLPEPLPKGLLQRADELSLSGCCQYVA